MHNSPDQILERAMIVDQKGFVSRHALRHPLTEARFLYGIMHSLIATMIVSFRALRDRTVREQYTGCIGRPAV